MVSAFGLKRFLPIVAFALICGLQTAPAWCQGITTGSILGSIADPQGSLIPQANITALEDATGALFRGVSGADGSFALRDLPIGTYTLTVESGNFLPLKVTNVQVNAGSITQIGTQKLSLGATATVTVEAGAPLLETSEAQVSSVFDSEAISSLPLNTNFDNLALLAPGVVQTHDAQFSNSNGVGISSNGQRGRSNNFEIDGQNNNDNNVAGPQIFFGNADAIQEIQVITDNFSAEYGRNMGSVVNYLTKSGTNKFHGTGFEYYTGSWSDSLANGEKTPLLGFCAPGQSPSTGCNPAIVPRSVDNKYGGTIGGPVLKDKLWFFGSTYWDHTRDGGSVSTSGTAITPTPAGLMELAAAFPGNPAIASLKNQGPFGITVGNPSVVAGSTVTKTVTNGTTSAAVQFGEVQRNVSALFNDEENLGRLDWQPSSHDRFFVRYFYQTYIQTGALGGDPAATIASGSFPNSTDTAHSIGADWTHTFSPSWLNQLRYGFQQTKSYYGGGGVPQCVSTNFTACPAEIAFESTNDFGYGYAANVPQAKIIKVTQVQDNANSTRGKHSIAFGGEFDEQNSPGIYLPYYNGTLEYQDFNSFLEDAGTLILTDGNPKIPLTESDVALYFQDDWKVMPALTVNLGLRWEFFGQAINELHNETLSRETGPNPFWSTALPLSVRVYPKIDQDWKNYQPRIGLAWNPGRKRLVIRGGYAINFDAGFYNIANNAAIEAPVANSGFITCGGGYQCLPAGGTTGALIRTQNLAALPKGGDPRDDVEAPVPTNFKNPYVQTYALGVQYQFGKSVVVEARYVGNHTSRLYQALDGNPSLLPLAQAFPNYIAPSALCMDPTQPGYGTQNCSQGPVQAEVANTAFSIYNGLQTNLTTQSFHGLTGTIEYTYSRTVDNTSEILPTGAGGNTLEFSQNPLNTNVAERGVSGISYPNVASFGFVYRLPGPGSNRRLAKQLLGGYSVNTVYGYNSGQPYNPFQGVTNQPTDYCDWLFNISVLGADSCRPVLTNRAAPNSPDSYALNTFSIANTLGNPFPGTGRNSLRGQSWNNLDASVFKTTQLSERIGLQLQVNAFNVFNRQYLGTPNAYIAFNDPSAPVNPFLSLAYNSGSIRYVQLGGRIIF
jgi:hypothetical protein